MRELAGGRAEGGLETDREGEGERGGAREIGREKVKREGEGGGRNRGRKG